MRAVQVSIRKNAQNKTYHNAAISSIADHLSSVYGLTRGSYPIQSAPTAQISAAKGFVEELNWAKDELEGLNIPDVDGVLNKIEQLAKNSLFFEIGMLVTSSSSLPKSEIDETISLITEVGKAAVKEKKAKSNVKSSGALSDTEFSEWKTSVERDKQIKEELQRLKREITGLKAINDEIELNSDIDEEVLSLAKQIKSAKLIKQANEALKEKFEVTQRKTMLELATKYLQTMPTTAMFNLELIDDMVVPKGAGGKEFPLHKTDKADGPSAGQGRLIANSVMLARYLLTQCNVP